MTNLLEPGEVPQVRKVAALLRLDGLHRAVVALKEDALAILLVLQRQTEPGAIEPRELLDELVLAQPLELRQPRDLGVSQTHLTRPPTTGGATLTFVEDGHSNRKGWGSLAGRF